MVRLCRRSKPYASLRTLWSFEKFSDATFLFAIIVCFFPMASTAQPYPSPISPRVNDFAQLLDAEGLAEVRGMLKSL